MIPNPIDDTGNNHSNNSIQEFVKIESPMGIYLLKVNNRNARTRCEICSKLTIKNNNSVFLKTSQTLRKLWIFKLSRVSQLVGELNFTLIIFLATLFFCHCRSLFGVVRGGRP